jgi:multidrug resistance efflux pump
MPATATELPVRRADLRIEPFGTGGDHVVKDPRSGGFFLLGEKEHFLLLQLDGQKDAEGVRGAYEQRFAEPLPDEDLDAFVEAAREQGMFVSETTPPPPAQKQNILYWRKRILDPDRLLARIEPSLRWVFTRGFLLISGAAILAGAFVLWANRDDFGASIRDAMRWESLVLGWCVLFLVGMLHECAHGLTCKHHGGEVREIGLLFMFFMPCFYCNVSDAWLFREKRKRLWVMLAGGYCDLVIWALAVFLWRVTEPGTLVHRVSFLVLGLSGVDSLFNFNPLIKLDGYYLLSDWKEIPNLRQRALERFSTHARRWLWGAPRPEPDRNGRFLTWFGFLSGAFSVTFLAISLVFLAEWFHGYAGAAGYVAAVLLVLPAIVAAIRGVCAGEVSLMIMKRRVRTLFWLLGLGGIAAALCLIRVDEYSGGTFTVRPSVREEIRGAVAGFLRDIRVEEGSAVAAGDVIARVEDPELDCKLAQKRAERKEVDAQLRLLEIGTRPEEIACQRSCVENAARWHAQAQADLERMKKALEQDLAALDERISEAVLQRERADSDYDRAEALSKASVATKEELERADHLRRIAKVRVLVASADRRARESRGVLEAEQELADREKTLGDERSRLALMEAGARPEEVAAQRARVDRFDVEIAHLEDRLAKREVRATVAGVVVTPRLKEKAGNYFREGDLVCVVEDRSCQRAEITLDEEKLRSIEPGQRVRFKARALPFDSLGGAVTGIAPCAAADASRTQGTVVVHCSMDGAMPVLRTSMSGYARIYTGRRSLGSILFDRAMRLFRTEFWW